MRSAILFTLFPPSREHPPRVLDAAYEEWQVTAFPGTTWIGFATESGMKYRELSDDEWREATRSD